MKILSKKNLHLTSKFRNKNNILKNLSDFLYNTALCIIIFISLYYYISHLALLYSPLWLFILKLELIILQLALFVSTHAFLCTTCIIYFANYIIYLQLILFILQLELIFNDYNRHNDIKFCHSNCFISLMETAISEFGYSL